MSKTNTKSIDGISLARCLREEAAKEIRELSLDPGLGVILVGDDPASHLYVSLKERACAKAGIRFEKFLFPAGAEEGEIITAIQELNSRSDIDAILIQLPLPAHLDTDRIILEMDPKKDVDGFHPDSVLTPGLATGILLLAEAADADLQGKTLHTISNSAEFAKPVEKLFAGRGITATDALDQADIVVIAVGKPNYLKKNMIRPGAIIIDVGTTQIGGKVVGDAEDLSGVAGAVTPVPGGVGPVTVGMLIKNTVELARRHKKK